MPNLMPVCLDCARRAKHGANLPDGEHACPTCGVVFVLVSRAPDFRIQELFMSEEYDETIDRIFRELAEVTK